MDYKKEVRIDEDALEIEWLEQAELAIKWGEYYNELEDEVRRAEQNEKIVRSELILKINQDPDKYLGMGIKATDAKVEAAMRTHKNHKAAKDRLLDALKSKSDAEVAYKEISYTRKAALEQLVTLHGQNYFAGPKMPRDIHKERQNRETTRNKSNERVRKIRRKKQ